MDDFLSKKRDSGPVLDLSKATATTKEEFRQLFDRVPDFKIKPEKFRPDEIKVSSNLKRMKFKTGKRDYKSMKETFLYNDPVPTEMKNLSMNELAAVPIDWKMLTSIRPKNKTDENFYSRLVELKKLELKTEVKDKRTYTLDPQVKKIKNRGGVVELRALNCQECMEDFCTGFACKQITYDYFVRVPEPPKKALPMKPISIDIGGTKDKKKKKKKERKPSPSKHKSKSKRRKSKSPSKRKQ